MLIPLIDSAMQQRHGELQKTRRNCTLGERAMNFKSDKQRLQNCKAASRTSFQSIKRTKIGDQTLRAL